MKKYLSNEKGITLVELLAALFIFLLIVIPLSSVYINGIQLFNKTQQQTDLRNEADFVISNVMTQVQSASYFDLPQEKNTSKRDQILSILKKAGLDPVVKDGIAQDQIKTRIQLYKLQVAYTQLAGSTEKTTESTMTRVTKGFDCPAGDCENLAASASYMIDGVFHLSSDKKRLILYLVMAPKLASGETSYQDERGQSVKFRDLQHIHDDFTKDYVRVVRTEFAVTNFQKG